VELGEAFLFGKVGVPEPDYLVNVELTGQVTRDPTVREVHKHKIHLLKVLQGDSVLLFNDRLHFVEHLVDTWLHFSVVVLDVAYKFS
jgi:hypothetical protein